MKVILVFALITGTAPVLQFQEFNTLAACQEVADKLSPQPSDYQIKKMVEVFCVVDGKRNAE